MADTVQYRLEQSGPELEDLHKRGLFSPPELHAIAAFRRSAEFRLQRPSPLKSDFLSYIQYESSLDRLRQIRKRKIIADLINERKQSKIAGDQIAGDLAEEGGIKKGRVWKRSVSDSAGIKRILRVYRTAVMRNKGELELWFEYLEFCRKRRHGRMKEALAQAIRYHTTVPGLWIYAASYEFDQNLNVEAARSLMQSGLRSCPKSEDLWIQYLRMELTYLNKLKARKEALGESVPNPKSGTGTDGWKEENKELFMALTDEKEERESGEVREGEKEVKEDIFWKNGVKMLEIIYQGAIEAVSESFELRKKFLEILRTVNLGDTDRLREEILSDLKRDFEKSEEFWDWFAKNGGNFGDVNRVLNDDVSKAVEIYEEALEKLPTEKMFSLYAKFWTEILQNKSNSHQSEEFTEKLLKLFRRAELTNCLNEGLACDYVNFYVKIGKLNEARDLSERLLSGERFSGSGKLWHLRVCTEIKCELKINFDGIFRLVKRALEFVEISQAEDLFLTGLKVLGNDKDFFEKMVKLVTFSMAKSSGGASVARSIIGSVLVRKGIKHARDMYNRFVSLPHPSLELFKYCIEIEFNLALNGNDKNALANVRKLYESALGFYAQDCDLWRDYYMMETKVGTAKTANSIYERARKTLNVDLTVL